MSTTILEREIETHLRKRARERGGMSLKLTTPGVRGVPDRIVIVPGIAPFFVEVKKPRGSATSKPQLLMHRKLVLAGAFVGICYTKEDVDAVFDTAATHTNLTNPY